MRKVIDWLEHRTGLETAVKSFLYEDIPASSGWHQVLGSMAAFFFMLQAVTGMLSDRSASAWASALSVGRSLAALADRLFGEATVDGPPWPEAVVVVTLVVGVSLLVLDRRVRAVDLWS
mgnify:CR=1 FL=1